ncbi:MAG: hypothetical protein P1U87_14105 [Verrucomicrobiales bacterium]|nr:hypothetical protein [Verrucomicrobiales bacterium]
MKHLILAILITGAAFFTVTPASAGYCKPQPKCAPKVYKIRTCEIDRCKYRKWAYDHCGKRYSYWVTVITYKDYYSNGSHRIWKNTIS